MLDILNDFNETVEALEKHNIRYAVVGGIAVAIHGGERSTWDADFLLHPDDVDRAVLALKNRNFVETSKAWTFNNTALTLRRLWRINPGKEDASVIDFLFGSDSRYLEIIAKADVMRWAVGTVNVARKEDIIWMKSRGGRNKDLADIEMLKSKQNDERNPS